MVGNNSNAGRHSTAMEPRYLMFHKTGGLAAEPASGCAVGLILRTDQTPHNVTVISGWGQNHALSVPALLCMLLLLSPCPQH